MIVHALHKQQNSPPRPIAAAKYLRAAGCYSSTHFSTEDNQIKPPPSFLLTVIAKKIQSTRNFCTFSFFFFFLPHSMFLYFIFNFGSIPIFRYSYHTSGGSLLSFSSDPIRTDGRLPSRWESRRRRSWSSGCESRLWRGERDVQMR